MSTKFSIFRGVTQTIAGFPQRLRHELNVEFQIAIKPVRWLKFVNTTTLKLWNTKKCHSRHKKSRFALGATPQQILFWVRGKFKMSLPGLLPNNENANYQFYRFQPLTSDSNFLFYKHSRRLLWSMKGKLSPWKMSVPSISFYIENAILPTKCFNQ